MSDRRQAARREPIETELADGRVFVAKPLPWMQANDLGNEIVRQNSEAANDFVRLYVTEDNIPQLEFKLKQKISDWLAVFVLAYPEETLDRFENMTIDECAAIVLAALEVNHLEQIKHLVDPNSPTPTLPGGTSSLGAGTTENGPRDESTPS